MATTATPSATIRFIDVAAMMLVRCPNALRRHYKAKYRELGTPLSVKKTLMVNSDLAVPKMEPRSEPIPCAVRLPDGYEEHAALHCNVA